MFNPNYIYGLVFLFVVIIYRLGWSDLYPDLSYPTLGFLLITILINLFIGFLLSKLKILKFNRLKTSSKAENLKIVTASLLLLWIVDKFFGDIPTIHIVLVTFTSFYNVYAFSRYLIEKKKEHFIIFFILFLCSVFLSTYRILIFFNLITCLLTFIYIRNPFKSFLGKLVIGVCSLGILYVFGYLGNNLKGEDYNTGELILNIGEANQKFRDSVIPNEFFWTYLYASSPLANLELNIKNDNSIRPSLNGYALWITSEFFPDFVSKKIFVLLDEKPIEGLQINEALNVSTIYMRSFRYASWFGIITMAIYIAVLPIFYLYLIRNSRFFIPGLVSIVTLYMFLVFDNMFAFSALSFQLIYPLLSLIVIRKRKKLISLTE